MNADDARVRRLIDGFCERLALDLSGLTVATEAGSGPFLYSSLAAALAGAERVIAVAPDSRYAAHREIADAVGARARAWGIAADLLTVVAARDDVPVGIDLFLNLGFLRPLDRALLARGSARAAVSYMCEAWEYRPGDLDLAYCRERGIPIGGVNENHGGFGVFDSCGQLAVKLLFEAGVEVAGCRIAVLGDDPFSVVIADALRANAAEPVPVRTGTELTASLLASLDALVVAAYSPATDLLADCQLSPAAIAALNPSLRIVPFAGSIDVDAFLTAGIHCHPAARLPPFRMARTLSHLGPRPVIALHSLGLKVGELLCRQRDGVPVPPAFAGLVQPMSDLPA